jgi:hypothetical protein
MPTREEILEQLKSLVYLEKVKVCIIRQHTTKEDGGLTLKLCVCSTSTPEGGEWCFHAFAAFCPGKYKVVQI